LTQLIAHGEAFGAGWLTTYYARHALPTSLRRWLGINSN